MVELDGFAVGDVPIFRDHVGGQRVVFMVLVGQKVHPRLKARKFACIDQLLELLAQVPRRKPERFGIRSKNRFSWPKVRFQVIQKHVYPVLTIFNIYNYKSFVKQASKQASKQESNKAKLSCLQNFTDGGGK